MSRGALTQGPLEEGVVTINTPTNSGVHGVDTIHHVDEGIGSTDALMNFFKLGVDICACINYT